MFYRSFFYECLVNLYFKKKCFSGCFRAPKCSFQNTQTYLVKPATKDHLNNLCTIKIYIRFSNKNFDFLKIQVNQILFFYSKGLTYYYFDKSKQIVDKYSLIYINKMRRTKQKLLIAKKPIATMAVKCFGSTRSQVRILSPRSTIAVSLD